MEVDRLQKLMKKVQDSTSVGVKTKDASVRALAYLRVSDETGEEKAQRKDIREWAEKNKRPPAGRRPIFRARELMH